MDAAVAPFGAMLRQWRRRSQLSQLALAADAEVSARHLSWLETGRAQPSRAMVLRLARRLDVPLRERNAWLLAAGFAPAFRERAWADADQAALRATVQQWLDAHGANPALVVDRHWTLLAANAAVSCLMSMADPALLHPPVNVLRVCLHPQGLAPAIHNLGAWRAHVLERLGRQARASGDAVLAALHDELAAYPGPAAPGAPAAASAFDADSPALPLQLNSPVGPLAFIGTITVFGAPRDVALAELAIETFLAADEATADRMRRWVSR